jgi:hypothetical protein
MKTLTIQLPDTVDEKGLYEKGIMSSGLEIHLVGISKREYIESVGQYVVSMIREF